jgi:voltage-gated potassium channel
MEPDLLFSARGIAAKACLREVIMYICVIAITGAMLQYVAWRLEPMTFNVPDGKCISFIDFLYWSVVTLSTVGYGDMYPKATTTQCVAMCEIILGWMYISALLTSLITLSVSSNKSFTKDGP